MPKPAADAFVVDESRPWFSEEAGWPDEVPKNFEFPELTVGELLREAAQKWPDRRAMWFLDTFIDYKTLDELVDRFASALHKAGLRKGDVIAMLLPNSFQYVIAYYAGARLGCPVSGINPTYKAGEALHQLKTVNARALIVLDALYQPTVAPIIKKSPVEIVIGTNVADLALSPLKRFLGKLLKKIPTGPLPPGTLRFKEMLKTPVDLPELQLDVHDDAATYIMTGGTTGVPKAAVLSHFNVVSNALQARLWIYKMKPGAANIGVLPLFHSFAMTAVMNASVSTGFWMMLFPRPPAQKELIEHIEKLAPPEGCIYAGAPILFQRMAEEPGIEQHDLSGLTLCLAAASPLYRHVQESFEAKTGARLVEAYGMTETSPALTVGPFWGNRKIGTVGLPLPGTELRIVEIEDPTKQLPPGPDNTGEIIAAGPQVMVSYLNQPEETADHIVEIDGKRWMRTGDIGWMDEQGRVAISDRLKQLIKYKGYSIFPKEIEDMVGQHEAVRDVAAAGIPDQTTGERIKIWVVLAEGFAGKVSEDDLLAWCKENLTHYKIPSYVEFRDELPKSLIGKVLRRVLQEEDPLFVAVQAEQAS